MSSSFCFSISLYYRSYFILVSYSFCSTFFLFMFSSYLSCSCFLYHSSISFFLTSTISASYSSTIDAPPISSSLSSSMILLYAPTILPLRSVSKLCSPIWNINRHPSVPVENKYLLSGETIILVISPAWAAI